MDTDAYVFLDIEHPVVAWAAYRGTLVSCRTASNEPGAISLMMAGLLQNSSSPRLLNELLIEQRRLTHHPEKISRLSGMFCFRLKRSAEKAADLWNVNYFTQENLAEISLPSDCKTQDFDSNWITYAPLTPDRLIQTDNAGWIDRYWNGEIYPGKEPILETLVEGQIYILGTHLRERAYKIVKDYFPQALTLLEIARLAAWIDSDLGNVNAWLLHRNHNLMLQYAMNMIDADKPVFLEKLNALIKSGHPVNWGDIQPNFAQNSFGRVPDLRHYGFSRSISEFPFVASSLPPS